jgi:hypothetical protein
MKPTMNPELPATPESRAQAALRRDTEVLSPYSRELLTALPPVVLGRLFVDEREDFQFEGDPSDPNVILKQIWSRLRKLSTETREEEREHLIREIASILAR